MLLRSLHTSTHLHRLATASVLALLLTAVWFSAALAHAIVVRSDPPDGGVVAKSPHEIHLWFSEAIAPQLTQARVLNVRGEAVPSTATRVDPSDPALLIVTVPDLPDGIYNVVYTALSAEDGHPTEGHMVFTIAAGATGQAAARSTAPPPVALAEAGLRWLNFLALAAVAGAVAVAFILLRPDQIFSRQSRPVAMQLTQARGRVLRWGGGCALVALLLGVALLVWQAALFAQPSGISSSPGPTMVEAALRLLSATPTGTLWLFRQAMLLVLAVLLFTLAGEPATDQPAPDPRRAGAILGLLCVAVLTTQALSGHAAAVSPETTIAVLVDLLHLVAASLWAGGLLALVVGLLKLGLAGRGSPAFEALVHAGWRPFGALAALSVGVLIATGLYSMGRQVASIDALLTTFYGRALIAKLVLVLAVGLLGLLNSSLLHPAVAAPLARLFRRPPGWTPLPLKRFPLLVTSEVALAALVFLATGLMTSATPPHGPQFAPAPPATGRVLMQRADDLLVTLQDVKPNQPGPNIITLRVADTRSPSPAAILRVIVHFSYQDQSLGSVTADAQPISPGVYQVAGDQLSLTGPWQVQVTVRRKGLEDSTTQFAWTVAAPGPARAVLISDRPLEPALTVSAAVILLAVLVIAAVVRLKRPRAPLRNGGETRLEG